MHFKKILVPILVFADRPRRRPALCPPLAEQVWPLVAANCATFSVVQGPGQCIMSHHPLRFAVPPQRMSLQAVGVAHVVAHAPRLAQHIPVYARSRAVRPVWAPCAKDAVAHSIPGGRLKAPLLRVFFSARLSPRPWLRLPQSIVGSSCRVALPPVVPTPNTERNSKLCVRGSR